MSLLKVIMLQLLQVTVVLYLVSLEPVDGRLDVQCSPYQRSTSDRFNITEAEEILDRHNELRTQVDPEAADMKFMEWDYYLADMAQQYAEQCIWGHGQPEDNISPFSPIGQNLWLGGGNADTFPSGTSATYAWYNEYQYYTYSSRKCKKNKACGHYTQMVWADTYAVGCGRSFCETATEPSKADKQNVWIIVCNYGPAGNYKTHPYVAGPNCTQCKSGSGQCYNGQCRPCSEHNEDCVCRQECKNCGTLNENCTCTCHAGFEGVDCANECKDNHRYCDGNGWYPAQCVKGTADYYEKAVLKCPKMCGTCEAADPNDPCETNGN